jgi:methyltransferase-like protein
MSSGGIAYISYNAYPGSYLRDMARDILHYHLTGVDEPQARLAAAQELMASIVSIEAPTPYAQALHDQLRRMLSYSELLLYHDDLAEISTPFYLHEFVEHAEKHGLAFLAEADLSDSRMRGVPDNAVALMDALPDDVVVREQYLDFFTNRMFRRTLLCHGEASMQRVLDASAISRTAIASPATAKDEETFETPEGFQMTTTEPHILAVMRALRDAWPGAVPYDDLLQHAIGAAGSQAEPAEVDARLRNVLIEAYLANMLQLWSVAPPVVAAASERPVAGALARAQVAAGMNVLTSMTHETVRLDGPRDHELVALLDGTRDYNALAAAAPPLEVSFDEALAAIARAGLLTT